MLERLFSLDYRRRRLAAKTAPGPLRDYLEVPFVSRKTSHATKTIPTTKLWR